MSRGKSPTHRAIPRTHSHWLRYGADNRVEDGLFPKHEMRRLLLFTANFLQDPCAWLRKGENRQVVHTILAWSRYGGPQSSAKSTMTDMHAALGTTWVSFQAAFEKTNLINLVLYKSYLPPDPPDFQIKRRDGGPGPRTQKRRRFNEIGYASTSADTLVYQPDTEFPSATEQQVEAWGQHADAAQQSETGRVRAVARWQMTYPTRKPCIRVGDSLVAPIHVDPWSVHLPWWGISRVGSKPTMPTTFKTYLSSQQKHESILRTSPTTVTSEELSGKWSLNFWNF